LTWMGGSKYVGQFKNGKLTGIGTYSWSNGRRYVGQWQDGKAHGFGTLRSNGTHHESGSNLVEYDGMWKNGLMNGFGFARLNTGETYEGDWYCNNKHGRGINIWANGEKFEGGFRDNFIHGKGTYTWPDGRSLSLEFVKNASTDAWKVATVTWVTFAVVSLIHTVIVVPYFRESNIFENLQKTLTWEQLGNFEFRSLVPHFRCGAVFVMRKSIIEMIAYILNFIATSSCNYGKDISPRKDIAQAWNQGIMLGFFCVLSLFALTFLLKSSS